MKKWLCIVCGWIYDEAKGWPDDGIAPGTRWEDIPDDWLCPDCGVSKTDFEMLEITGQPPSELAAVVAISAAPTFKSGPPIVIIGSGHAGYNLAEAIRQRDPQQEIIVFTADDGANYSKPGLSNALTRNKQADQLISETVLDLEHRLNIRIYAHCKVQSIDADQHQITTDFGIQQYKKLVLALGAEPILLPFKGDGASDVLRVNNLADYRHFREQLDSNSNSKKEAAGKSLKKHITIIGNGLIGCEFANDLSSQGHQVAVVGLTGWPMDRLIPQTMGEQLAHNLQAQGVSWYLENTVTQITKQDTALLLSLQNGQQITTDIVLSAVGLKPCISLAQSAGVICDKGIIVNGGLRTNVADIYALGDCAEIQGQLLPFIAPINFAIPALANCLLGKPTMAQYPHMPVMVKTPALPLTLLAPKVNDVGQWQVEITASGSRGLFLSDDGALLGFALAGDMTKEWQQWLDKMIGEDF